MIKAKRLLVTEGAEFTMAAPMPRRRDHLAPLLCGGMQEMTTAEDPVCKMKVEIESAKLRSIFEGKNYFFCAPGCKKAFDEEPRKYL